MDITTFMLAFAAATDFGKPGQASFLAPGTYSFTVPVNVYSLCAALVGSGQGGGANNVTNVAGRGGSGGDFRYINDLPVTPLEVLTIEVGTGGAGALNATAVQGATGTNTRILRGTNVILSVRGNSPSTALGTGSFGGTIGGASGGLGTASINSTSGGPGGGAGGYSGDGGSVTGGAAGSAIARASLQGASGGGVGVMGQGTSGANGDTTNAAGKGGSGGSDGALSGPNGGIGALYGGGGGGAISNNAGGKGGDGACRIIWGTGRAYPSTRTADE